MIRSKLFAVLALFLAFGGAVKAQAIDIFLSEYSATNVNGPTDYYGQHSDWVELQSTFSQSVSLADHYLSNDRLNLLKWKFPDTYALKTNELKVVWLSGRNTIDPGGGVHANFQLDQCKGQWLILANSKGVIRDSIFVRPTMADHSRGRIDNKLPGATEWRLFASPSFLQPNNKLDNYKDYAPKPEIYISQDTNFTPPNKGGFYPGNRICYIRLQGQNYDTIFNKCFNVFYTLSEWGDYSNYPVPKYPPDAPTMQYFNKLNSPFPIARGTVVRAIAVHNSTVFGCTDRYYPSFCETNTYFMDPNQNNIAKDFGVLSIAMDKADTSWFTNVTSATTVHVEYYDNKQQLTEGYAIISKPPQEKWATLQKGFYLTMDDRLGFGCAFEGNIFNVAALGTSNRTVFPTIHVYGGDYESHSKYLGTQANESFGTAMRDVFMQTLAVKNKLNVSPLHIKPIVAVKEGKYWGVFQIKEVYDKYYEQFYYGQNPDSLTLNFVQNGIEGHVSYWDNSSSKYRAQAWRSEVYDFVMGGNPLNSKSNYESLMSVLDKNSMIDYFVLNSYAVNTNLFQYDVAIAKGENPSKPGGKWHFYLWNTPGVFSFTQIPLPQQNPDFQMGRTPCYYFFRNIDAIPTKTTGNLAFMGLGNVYNMMMRTEDNTGNTIGKFQLEFRTRYMDLMNGPLSCKSLDAHWKTLFDLYLPEMKKHEDAAMKFGTATDSWKKNMDTLRKVIQSRCFYHEDLKNPVFGQFGCFDLPGPYNLSVDVQPPGAGKVQLNSTILDSYVWTGKYYATPLSFKAIPSGTNYAFHHWEFKNHDPWQPTTADSVSIDFNSTNGDEVIAVFTDKTRPITGGNVGSTIPTGFTPNGDGLNEVFRPLGSAEFVTNYELMIFNRWGQEVFRSTNPENGWDGNFKGQQAITGVYAYVISYRSTTGEDVIVKGNVTLTR